MKTIIESILKSEREVKAVSSSDNLLITNGPYDLFKLIYSIFEIFKKENFKIKYIIQQFLSLTKECISQYLIGIDCVVSRTDLEIDIEFLIAIANNSPKLNSQYEELIESIKNMKILTEDEVDEAASHRKVINLLMLTSNNAMIRFVTDLSDNFLPLFEENFMILEISKILQITFNTYAKFTRYMHHSIQRKTWGEVVKSILFYYIKSLLTTAGKKIKKIEDLTKKIRTDKQEILEAFEEVAGENLVKETLKILDDFLDFLDVSTEMIGLSCSKIREYNGPQFTISTVKALINLRCDFNKEEKNDAINSCKIILDNFHDVEGVKRNSGLLENLESEIKLKENQEKEEQNKEAVLEKLEDSIRIKKRNTLSLADILNIEASDKADLDETVEYPVRNRKSNSVYTSHTFNLEDTRDSDVIHSGNMQKKSHST